jgi:ribonuclease Z
VLKIKFIGTGSAKISLQRNFTSLLFETEFNRTLIDCGDGIPRALIQQGINLNSLNKIIITHLHPDHYTGLSTLITQFKLNDRTNPLQLISARENLLLIKNFLSQSFIISERLNFELIFESFEFEKEFRLSENLKFIAKQNSHLEKYAPYQKQYNLSLASPSFLFFYKNTKILYSSDIGKFEDLLLFEQTPDILICEVSHIEINQIENILKKLNPQKTYLIHIPDEKEKQLSEFINLNKEKFRQVELTVDGQEIVID